MFHACVRIFNVTGTVENFLGTKQGLSYATVDSRIWHWLKKLGDSGKGSGYSGKRFKHPFDWFGDSEYGPKTPIEIQMSDYWFGKFGYVSGYSGRKF